MGPSVTDWLTTTLTQEFNRKHVDEVWVINMAINAFRADLVFWMDDLIQQHKFRPKLIEALRDFDVPVITSTARPELVPKSYDYPIQEVCNISVPILGKPYLNNGVAQALAYAMHKNVEEISIYGADFSYPNRDFAESGRGCVESWIVMASFKGMRINLCQHTSLMDTVKDHGIYGYSEQPEIDLPNGQKFKYVKITETMGKYIPEDTSGVTNVAVPSQSGGAGGEPAAAAVAGRNGDADKAAQPAAPAVGGPGGSLRGDDPEGRYETGHLGVHDSGGKGRDVQEEAALEIPRAPGIPLPRHQAR